MRDNLPTEHQLLPLKRGGVPTCRDGGVLLQCLFLSILIFFNPNIIAQPVITHGQLKVIGNELHDQDNEMVVLKGVSLGWHNWWSRFYNPAAIETLAKDWKCSVVRIAMGIEPEGGYLENPEQAIKTITPVIEAAIKENIYVIIDWHSHNMHASEAKAFFTEMARRYGKYPHIIYEIFNEPDDETWSQIKEYSYDLIEAIRAIDPDNLILVGTPDWSQDVDEVANDPLTGFNNIMYTVHFYAASHQNELRKKVRYATSKELPVFVSECAASYANGDGELNLKQMKKWLGLLERKKISRVIWSVSDKPESSALLVPNADPSNWSENELTPAGKIARSVISGKPVRRFVSSVLAGISVVLFVLMVYTVRRRLSKNKSSPEGIND